MKAFAILSVAVALGTPRFSTPPSWLPDVSAHDVLRSSSVIEPLNSETVLSETASGFIVEPGIRASRNNAAFSLATHDGSGIEVQVGERFIHSASPLLVLQSNDNRWNIAGQTFQMTGPLVARRRVQDDTDSNLKSMQESAKKLKSKTQDPNANQPGKKLRVRWLFGENPMPTAELFNTPAIQQLTHLSNIGF